MIGGKQPSERSCSEWGGQENELGRVEEALAPVTHHHQDGLAGPDCALALEI